jgi:DNA helicase-2/ATP-dependent DNA helicase PcrA
VTRARTTLHVLVGSRPLAGARGTRGPPGSWTGSVRPSRTRPPAGSGGRRLTKASRSVGRCRSCGRPLPTAAERKIGRCEDCPATYDEALFERLRAWRTDQASAQKVPAYVVFTDATLTAIAETRPTDQRELLRIPGLGKAKLDRYGDDVLALLSAGSEGSAQEP